MIQQSLWQKRIICNISQLELMCSINIQESTMCQATCDAEWEVGHLAKTGASEQVYSDASANLYSEKNNVKCIPFTLTTSVNRHADNHMRCGDAEVTKMKVFTIQLSDFVFTTGKTMCFFIMQITHGFSCLNLSNPRFQSVLHHLSHCLQRLSCRQRELVGSLILFTQNRPAEMGQTAAPTGERREVPDV